MTNTATRSPEELPSRKRLALRYLLTYLVAILATTLVVALKDQSYDYEGENVSVLVFLYVGTFFPNGIFCLFGRGAIFGDSDLALFMCTAGGYVLVLSLFAVGVIWRKRNIYLVFVLLLILNFGGCVLGA